MPIIDLNDYRLPNPVTYAQGRLTTRTYVSKSFTTRFGRDAGHPGRYIHRVFDEEKVKDEAGWDWTVHVIYTTPGGRKQIELHVAREAGSVRRLRIQKVPTSGDKTKLEQILDLDREQSARLIDTLKALEAIPVEGEGTVRVDDQLLRDIFTDPNAMRQAYDDDPARFRAFIESDVDARDVIALQRRRVVAAKMRQWLEDEEAFTEASAQAGGPERAWQALLEENPWVLGVGLGGQLFTSWQDDKLEQTVTGQSIGGVGKRADALLRTAGIVRALVFAEIKHHKSSLLGEEYRSGAWAPSREVSGAVTQVQQTVHLASRSLGEFIHDRTDYGEVLGQGTFILQPRSFVVVGCLEELVGDGGGPIPGKVRSFELFRRNLFAPEVITFDELIARADWYVEAAEREVGIGSELLTGRGEDSSPAVDVGSTPEEPPF